MNCSSAQALSRQEDRCFASVRIAVLEDQLFATLALAKGMTQRVRANMLYQTRVRGVVVKEGEREMAKWSLGERLVTKTRVT